MKLNRENKLLIGLCTAAGILILKLFSIQIIEDKYKLSAENNTMVYSTIYPTRGIIHDRNGNILVGNRVAYDLMVTPREVSEFDTLALAKVLDVTYEAVPFGGAGKIAGIYADGVVFRNIRRVASVRILYVYVLNAVVAVKLPHRRNLNKLCFVDGTVGRNNAFGHLFNVLEVMKIPVAVK